MVTTHLDIYLLVLLGRARVKELSSRLGQAAAELRSLVGSTSEGVATGARHRPHADVGDADQVARGRGAGPAPGAQAVPTLDAAIDKAITLDSEAVVFLAGEWWTDVTDAPLGDRLLRWMQATGGLADPSEARRWYDRASRLGSGEAAAMASRLDGGR